MLSFPSPRLPATACHNRLVSAFDICWQRAPFISVFSWTVWSMTIIYLAYFSLPIHTPLGEPVATMLVGLLQQCCLLRTVKKTCRFKLANCPHKLFKYS